MSNFSINVHDVTSVKCSAVRHHRSETPGSDFTAATLVITSSDGSRIEVVLYSNQRGVLEPLSGAIGDGSEAEVAA